MDQKEIMNNEIIQKEIHKRAERHTQLLAKLFVSLGVTQWEGYIAGGCLTHEVNDIDIFQIEGKAKPFNPGYLPVWQSKNADTYSVNGKSVQICSYGAGTLQELVDSFDYAHIKVGAKFTFRKTAEGMGVVNILPENVYVSDDFINSNVLRTTWFTTSKYPLSSLIRARKYAERGLMSKGQYNRAIINCLADVVKRGFASYNDFKDQLDAIDLGLLPEDLDEVSKANLMELYTRLGPPQV